MGIWQCLAAPVHSQPPHPVPIAPAQPHPPKLQPAQHDINYVIGSHNWAAGQLNEAANGQPRMGDALWQQQQAGE